MKIEVEDGLSAEQQDTVKAFALAVKQGSKLGLEIWQFSGKWANVSDDGFFLLGAHYRIKKPTAEDYLRGHEASGLKVGDRVRVLREPEHRENGWPNNWMGQSKNPFENIVGSVFTIKGDDGKSGFHLDTSWDNRLPHFVLEKVEPTYRPWTAAEAIQQVVRRKGGSGTLYSIVSAGENGWHRGNSARSWGELLRDYETADGTPCGILIKGGEA